MSFQLALFLELHLAQGATKGPFIGMHSFMSPQLICMGKLFETLRATETLVIRMHNLVPSEGT